MPFGIIYKIKNKINGKSYIGQTTASLSIRKQRHVTGKFAIGNALRKYGKDAFEDSILYEAKDSEDLNLAEIRLIKEENTLYPNGYNLMPGGQARLLPHSIEKMKKTKSLRIFKQSEELIERRMKKIRKPIQCITDGNVFSSAKEAGDFYKCSPSHISKQLKGKLKTVKNLKFKRLTGGGLSHL